MLDFLIALYITLNISTVKYEVQKADISTKTVAQSTGNILQKREDNIPKNIKGYVSHYSANLGSCLGCRTYWDSKGQPYWITASGERLDNSKYTIASNDFEMGTKVTLLNTRNRHSCSAEVTDTGGFNRLNRVADLTPLVAECLDSRTDQDIISITAIP